MTSGINLDMHITEKEIESVNKLEPLARYKYLIKRIASFQRMYSLKKDDEWAIAEIEGYKVFSIWSAKEFALLNTTGNWQDYQSTEIDFGLFEEEIVPLIRENNYLLNVFSVKNKSGFVVDIDEFLNDLSIELKNYE